MSSSLEVFHEICHNGDQRDIKFGFYCTKVYKLMVND